MYYLVYNFKVTPFQPGSEILMALIAEYGFDSFELTEQGFKAYILESLGEDLNFDHLKFDDFTYSYLIEKIENINWNAEWEKNFEPILIDDLLCIRAPFHVKNDFVKYEIIIMPKMSFGTGHHPTTRLMCQEMFKIDFKKKRVLDMGCGTGILAILAIFIGALEVLGIDIDEYCVENSKENSILNNCFGIQIKKGDVNILKSETSFDVIMANINKNILIADMRDYSEKLNVGGKLLLSGFFKIDIPELIQACKINNLIFKFSSVEDEWAMMLLEKF